MPIALDGWQFLCTINVYNTSEAYYLPYLFSVGLFTFTKISQTENLYILQYVVWEGMMYTYNTTGWLLLAGYDDSLRLTNTAFRIVPNFQKDIKSPATSLAG